jgi:DNA-directed RNA polymerase III subunit RPC3
MIQHHLVYHYTAIEEGVTYYSANIQAAYYLNRSGKILEFVEDRLGKYAATVLSTIMYLGHAQVSLLDTLPELRPNTPQANGNYKEQQDLEAENGVNGMNGEHSLEQSALLHPALKALAGHGYIVRVREAHLQSDADNILDIERQIRSGDGAQSLRGKKLEEYVFEKTAGMLKERLDGDLSRGLVINGIPRGVKRRHANGISDDPDNNRARFDYDSARGEEEEDNEWFDDEIPMEVLFHIFVLILIHKETN